ncbi:hypothetical protein COSHB9_02830 [Companilactobacillus alimentarius]
MKINVWGWVFIIGFLGALINFIFASSVIGVLRSGFMMVILILLALRGD